MHGVNIRRMDDDNVGLALDETSDDTVLGRVAAAFGARPAPAKRRRRCPRAAPLQRLPHPSGLPTHRSETEMLRYLRSLADKDIALDRSMIPLGSCTMKLNATTEMAAVTWPEFGPAPPVRPLEQTDGYRELITSLEAWLAEITGYDACRSSPTPGHKASWPGFSPSAATTSPRRGRP